jgi:hypothetical protein
MWHCARITCFSGRRKYLALLLKLWGGWRKRGFCCSQKKEGLPLESACFLLSLRSLHYVAAKFVSFILGSANWELKEMFLKNGCRYCLEVHYWGVIAFCNISSLGYELYLFEDTWEIKQYLKTKFLQLQYKVALGLWTRRDWIGLVFSNGAMPWLCLVEGTGTSCFAFCIRDEEEEDRRQF